MKKTRKNNHVWSKEDNIVALYYYRFGTQFLELTEREIAKQIGTTVASLKMQSKNFEMLDTGVSGLSDFSDTQEEVWNEYGKSIRYVLFKEVKKALDLDKIIMARLVKQKTLKGFRRLKPVSQ